MRTHTKAILSSILATVLFLAGCPSTQQKVGSFYPGSVAVIQPNSYLTPWVFTATSQTVAAQIPPSSYCLIQLLGNTLTTATLTIEGSVDGGTTYFPMAVSPYVGSAAAATVLTAITFTSSPKLYMANCAGFDHIEAITSSTFTATSVTVNVSTTSNVGPYPVE